MGIEGKKLSQTMRIDLIPDIPADQSRAAQKQVVISPPTRKHRRVGAGPAPSEESVASRYDELLQSLYDAAIITDEKGHILDVNVRASEFLLYERQELIGMAVFEVISGSDESLIKTLQDNLGNERFTLIQAYCIRKDNSYFPAEVAVSELALKEKSLCFFIRDVTLRRQAEEMLRTEHNAIQNSGSGIAITDLELGLEYVNPAVVRLWGYDGADEMLGRSVCDLSADPDACLAMLTGVMREQSSWSGEMRACRKNGEVFNVQVSAACNRNSDGATVGVVLSLADISDRIRADQAERDAERHRVMLESLGAACHHLGQPATVLLANLGIMQKCMGTVDAGVLELVHNSIEAAETLGDILHKLNTVNEYRTTRYLERPDGEDSAENRILDI